MKDFVVVAKIYNNQLRQRRLELGLGCREMAERIGIHYSLYLRYESMKINPVSKLGTLTPSARKICDFHGLGPDELFPEAMKALEARVVERKFDAEEAGLLEAYAPKMIPSPEDFVMETETKKVVSDVLSTLTPREERVIRARFGLDDEDGEGKTLREVGEEFETGSERMRQNEAQALRKLRHPRRSKRLRFLVDDGATPLLSLNLDIVEWKKLSFIRTVFEKHPELMSAIVYDHGHSEPVFFERHVAPIQGDDVAVIYRSDCPAPYDEKLVMFRHIRVQR